jgi:hypothetical protein
VNKQQLRLKNSAFSAITPENRDCWFGLINIYDQIGNDDALKGVWSFLADEDGAFSKDNDGGDMNLVKLS